MLDLGCGLGGANKAMRDAGWDVVTVDINSEFQPDIVADLREWSWDGPQPDLIWASPPCLEFSRFSMPCFFDVATLPEPDMSIVEACKRIIDASKPRYWVIENVRGAIPFFADLLGPPRVYYRPFALWGFFPDLGNLAGWLWKQKASSPAKRAMIPEQISATLCKAIEGYAACLV